MFAAWPHWIQGPRMAGLGQLRGQRSGAGLVYLVEQNTTSVSVKHHGIV